MIHSNAIILRSQTSLDYDVNKDQLRPFLPCSVSAKQVNYGQGEGQIQIEKCIWGIYEHYGPDIGVAGNSYKIQFEEGTLSLPSFSKHIELIKLAAESFFNVTLEVEIQGCWTEESGESEFS